MVSELPSSMGDPLQSMTSEPMLSIAHSVTLKLTTANYLLWRMQFETFLDSQFLLGFVDGSSPCPSSTVTVNRGGHLVEETNPEFTTWSRRDRTVRSWIYSTLSEDSLRMVYGLRTAREVWSSLAQSFNRISLSRKSLLQRRFQNLTKQGRTMIEFLGDVKTVCDQLGSIGFPVTNQERIYGVLHGLGKEYESIATNIEGALDTGLELYYDDVVARLLNFEEKQHQYTSTQETSSHMVFNTDRGYNSRGNNFESGRNNSYHGRGQNFGRGQGYNRGKGSYSTSGRGFPQQFSRDTPREFNSRPICQICNKIGHPAFKCYRRFDQAFNNMDQPVALTAFRMNDQGSNAGHEWFPDTGATAHITNSADHLFQPYTYAGSDNVIVGNGDFLPITHTGTSGIPTQQGMLPLHDVLVCPSITKSLLSVSKLTMDYPCVFTFDSQTVIVKDKVTDQILTQGKRHNDLYTLQDYPFQSFYSIRQQSTSDQLWHLRLGHPNPDVLQQLIKDCAITVTKSSPSVCTACQLGKSCRLPFTSSTFVSSRPLERLHCDIWGPAPVISPQGFQYYVLFVDHFSRYTWLYPLKRKSDFFNTFVVFQKLVELQCQHKITSFQSDGGGEFTSKQFQTHLAHCGIKHQLSCPYTPQQNGLAERKHRHITELALTMLFQCQAPLHLWVEAFFTSVFLGNLLPCSVLQDKRSPYEVLTGKSPDYTSLRVFGSACYPYLRPYAAHKFDPKSLMCVFLGYNERYKGYRCYHPPSEKVYICRHVIFDEQKFPFADTYKKFVPKGTSTLYSSWQSGHSVGESVSSVPTSPCFEELISEPGVLSMPITTENAESTRLVNAESASSDQTQTAAVSPLINMSSADTHNSFSHDSLIEASSAPESQESSALQLHPMKTRSQMGIVKPNPRYALLTVKSNYPEPKTVKTALKDAGWTAAMQTEINTLHETNTWDLVPPSSHIMPLGCKWVFKTKLHADGSLHRLKARLVAKGYEQEEGLDFIETYSPVVKTATVRTVLHFAVTQQWKIQQLDVTNAFLHGDLNEDVYMCQPTGFEDPARPHYLCKLKKAIYGLKQAPRAWFDKFSTYLLAFGFKCSLSDPSLFVYQSHQDKMYLLLYVDDMILTGNNSVLLESLLTTLNTQFRMKDLGELHYFLGIQAHQHSEGLFLCQAKYIIDLLITACLQDCSEMPTPLPHQPDRIPGSKELFSDPTYFRSLAGKLQYLTLTRPDIQFAVNFICQKMHQPSQADFQMLKRILRYLKGTATMGIDLHRAADNTVRAYSDSDWASCKETRRSTGGFCTFLGTNIISWSAKRHPTVSKSSTEAEYRTLSLVSAELTWIYSLLRDLGYPPLTPAEVYCDNISAVYLTVNPALHSRSKHFDIDFHYVRERVALGAIVVKHVPSTLQLADVFTKSLLRDQFCSLRYKLGVDVPSTPSLRGYIGSIGSSGQQDMKKKRDVILKDDNAELTCKRSNTVKTNCKIQNAEKACGTSLKNTKPKTSTYNRFELLNPCDSS